MMATKKILIAFAVVLLICLSAPGARGGSYAVGGRVYHIGSDGSVSTKSGILVSCYNPDTNELSEAYTDGSGVFNLGSLREGHWTITVNYYENTPGYNDYQATANAGWSARECHTSVVFDGKMWVLGGYDGEGLKKDVWYSTDGVNWTQATANAGWSARATHTSVVFDGKMWVIGGEDKKDVWYSTDGVNWTQATANAGWSTRFYHTSVVFDGKMWVIGGIDEEGDKNDVWYSTDGVNWTQATANAGWSARECHTSVVFDGKMWVLGGYAGYPIYKKDVWYSTDGVNWTQATANAGWSARATHTSVVFDGKMWVIGGQDGSYKNDVWYITMWGTVPLPPLEYDFYLSGSAQFNSFYDLRTSQTYFANDFSLTILGRNNKSFQELGQPLPTVTLQPASWYSVEGGYPQGDHLVFYRLPYGAYTLSVTHPNYASYQASISVDHTTGSKTVTLQPLQYALGRVYSSTDQNPANVDFLPGLIAKLTVLSTGENRLRQVDEDGYFEFDAVPLGEVEISIYGSGYSGHPYRCTMGAEGVTVDTVAAGNTIYACGTVSGEVRDNENKPVPVDGLTITLAGELGSWTYHAYENLGVGSFAFERIPVGSYTLTIADTDYQTHAENLTLGHAGYSAGSAGRVLLQAKQAEPPQGGEGEGVGVGIKGIVLVAAGVGAVVSIVLLALWMKGRKAEEWETAPPSMEPAA